MESQHLNLAAAQNIPTNGNNSVEPFCRRHIAAQALLDPTLREMGVESLTVVDTPIDRARLYSRYHPMPDLLAASDPQRTSHRAFGPPNLEFTEKRGRMAAQDINAGSDGNAGRYSRRASGTD